MLSDKEFKRVEKIMYKYYEYKKEIKTIEKTIILLNTHIKRLNEMIRTTDITVNNFYRTSSAIHERVQTSFNYSSDQEMQVVMEIEKLEREKEFKRKKILKLQFKKMGLENFISTIGSIIEDLEPKEQEFMKYKYKDKMSVFRIYNIMQDEFHLTQSRFYAIRNNILEKIYITIKLGCEKT